MRNVNARKLVTLSEHRRRGNPKAVLPIEPDPSEADTVAVPALPPETLDAFEKALEAFRVPRPRARTSRVEPLRTDVEERYGA